MRVGQTSQRFLSEATKPSRRNRGNHLLAAYRNGIKGEHCAKRAQSADV